MADKYKWETHARNIKEKKQLKRKDNTKAIGYNIVAENEMIVQRLASEPSGKSMKYEKYGPQEFVPYPYEVVTLDLIKKSCYEHFKTSLPDAENARCDILASQNGPSCSKLSHIKNFKLIHVRFIHGKPTLTTSTSVVSKLARQNDTTYSYKPSTLCSAFQMSAGRQNRSSDQVQNRSSSATMRNLQHNHEQHGAVYPKSISIAAMLKIGSPISYKLPTATTIKLLEFDVGEQKWSSLNLTKNMLVDTTPFAKGGFRSVYKARSTDDNKDFVVKRFLPGTLAAMEEVNRVLAEKKTETKETFARKAIQTHMLARNFTEQLTSSIQSKCSLEFGKTFSYNKAYFGIIEEEGSSEYVMVEEYIPGDFCKYLNNNGVPVRVRAEDLILVEKACCLAHFSYEKSQGKLLLVDVQGSNYILYDPEIASTENALDEEGGLRFCLGNLSKEAFKKFLMLHDCNQYCKLIGLKELQKNMDGEENSYDVHKHDSTSKNFSD